LAGEPPLKLPEASNSEQNSLVKDTKSDPEPETEEKPAPEKIKEITQDTFDEFKKGIWGMVGLYIDCKCALKLWPRETGRILEDRIIQDVLKINMYGDKEQLKSSILKRIDKVMVKHIEKEAED
jgi:hypothetical protein